MNTRSLVTTGQVNTTEANFYEPVGFAPHFYRNSYHWAVASMIFFTVMAVGASIVYLLFLLAVFVPAVDSGYLHWGVNWAFWPIIIPATPAYLLLVWTWLLNLITYFGFRKEFHACKNRFPTEPTNCVKRTFVSMFRYKNNLAWFSAAVYLTLVLSVILVYIIVFIKNSWLVGGQRTINYTAHLIAVELGTNDRFIEVYSFRNYVIIVGIIATCFLVIQIVFNVLIKLRISQIENYYGGADKVVDATYLANRLKFINRRNMILFACYTVVLVLLFILIIKIPQKIFPKLNLKEKLLHPFK
ncbi:ABC-type cobalt transport system substrate-binding protein [Mycoplasmoides fastidiosum]|uniref:ABC-type cobalt transport system substrate-binding protein n=1 Tax=Mycoplasmoides fastidiosum TaxID=92758 RepID=A0ABU0LZI8_9BACT|nr:hypothetical protein [Mycoplasmoides fastidiosum]MDQ0514018.1 ABC-type cobalt transport system substrate-binding protein [Mycoplasmoides fastidiosum]UUD37572.1 hypothetical protein NPA10_03325 [Mycoplasmoides fastidiosum]